MSAARKVLIVGGLALAAFGMLYGLHYAVFVEHQTLGSDGRIAGTGICACRRAAGRRRRSAIDDRMPRPNTTMCGRSMYIRTGSAWPCC